MGILRSGSFSNDRGFEIAVTAFDVRGIGFVSFYVFRKLEFMSKIRFGNEDRMNVFFF